MSNLINLSPFISNSLFFLHYFIMQNKKEIEREKGKRKITNIFFHYSFLLRELSRISNIRSHPYQYLATVARIDYRATHVDLSQHDVHCAQSNWTDSFSQHSGSGRDSQDRSRCG